MNPHYERRWLILAVLCLAQLMVVLDATVVNIALPSAQKALHFSTGAEREGVRGDDPLAVPERTKAFGIYSAIACGGSAVGLLLGGALTQYLTWRYCLYVNLLLAVPAAIGLATEATPPTAKGKRPVSRSFRVPRGF